MTVESIFSDQSASENLKEKIFEHLPEVKQADTEEIPQRVWNIVFIFSENLKVEAKKFNAEGKDGTLYSNYFIRQGNLSSENDLILKDIASKYLEEIEPINSRANSIIEESRAEFLSQKPTKNQALPKPPEELQILQSQKDEITLRYRDRFRGLIGEDAFRNFSIFLTQNFLTGSSHIQLNSSFAPSSPQAYDAYNILVYDDDIPTVSGWAALYFDFNTGYYYHPKVYSQLRNATTGQILSFRSHQGFRSSTPARVDHPTYFATRGYTYCQYSEYYAVTFNLFSDETTIKEISASPESEIFIRSLEICRTYPFLPTPTPTPTPATPTPTPNVTSITFEQVTPSSVPIEPNPTVAPHNPGIGQRIFPDDDSPQDGVDRRRVRVTATLSQPIPNVNVYFRNFDLDDPATDPTIDPNGIAGDDNNGTPTNGQLQIGNGCGVSQGITFCPSDSSGRATIEFTVTRQPGDNFAIAASVMPAEVGAANVSGTELTNGSGQNIPTNCSAQLVCRSQMLTVWRRLHMEIDSMGASNQNFVLGRTTQTVRLRAGQQGTIPITSSQTIEPNRFENGRIIINSRPYAVVSNTANSVTVAGPNALTTIIADNQYQLFDDDDFNDDDGTNVDGDTGEDIDEPNRNLLQPNDIPCSDTITTGCNVFAQAYIRPVEDITADVSDNNIFQANVSEDTTAAIRSLFVDFDQRATEASTEYWTVYLLGGYQYTIDEDEDPETEAANTTVGVSDVQNGQGSIVFLETNGPKECNTGGIFCNAAETAAHEIGHLANADHNEGGLMDDLSLSFSPTSLSNIRNSTHP